MTDTIQERLRRILNQRGDDDCWFDGTDVEVCEALEEAILEIDRLRARIEELESTWGNDEWRLHEALRTLGMPETHYIFTTEQIEKAWDKEFKFQTDPLYRDDRRGFFLLASDLGIVECEDCKKHPGIWSSTSGVKCPTCHGHRWRKE